jgi:hypothetical protein
MSELGQLGDFYRHQTKKIVNSPDQNLEVRAALKPILDRLIALLAELQAIAPQMVLPVTGNNSAVVRNLTTFVTEKRDTGSRFGGDLQQINSIVQDELLIKASDREEVDFNAAAAEAAAVLAAAAEAERLRLEAEAAALAAGSGAGFGGGSPVDSILSAITKTGLSPGGGGVSGGHPFTALGCVIGAAAGEPVFGCAVGFAIDEMLKAEEER